MRTVRKQWSGRLFAVVAALALICASGVGAYAHTAGHHHNDGDSHAMHASDGASAVHAHTHGGDKPSHPCAKHGSGHDAGHADCCDLMCHGWTALVGAKFALPMPLLGSAGPMPARIAAGVWPASLDRPPRPLVLA